MYMNNVRYHGDGLDARIAHSFGIQAVAGIPLIHGDASVGAMLLADARNPQRFREEDLAPAMLLGNLAATALYHASMHDQLRKAYTRTLETLGEAIDVRDAYTGGHSQRIARYAEHIARAVGCSAEDLEHIRTGAMLHDIGKIGIPDGILLKPGHLTEREMEIMKSHSLIGARLLRTAGFPDEVVKIVRHLHERYDDYPSGTADPTEVFSSVVACLLNRFGQFAGEQVVGTIVHRLTVQAARQGWGVQLRDGELDVQAPERQAALEARRQVLTWLLLGIEQLGGARIALHLLTEAVEQLSPQGREVYRVLLSPTQLGEAAGPPQNEVARSVLL